MNIGRLGDPELTSVLFAALLRRLGGSVVLTREELDAPPCEVTAQVAPRGSVTITLEWFGGAPGLVVWRPGAAAEREEEALSG